MDVHQENLKKMCRLCGCSRAIAPDRKPYMKESYKNHMKVGLEIDIDNDTVEVFPPYVCNHCRRRLDDWNKTKKKKKKKCTGIEVYGFVPHSESCRVCSRADGGTEATEPDHDSPIQIAAKSVAGRVGFLSWQLDDGQWVFLTLDKKTLCVDRAIYINRDNTWSLQVNGMTVPKTNCHLQMIQELLKESDLEQLFSKALLRPCIGNPCSDFENAPWNSGTVFKDNQGKNKIAEVDAKYVFHHEEKFESMTVRHLKCSGLARSGKSRCDTCSRYRDDLYGKINRLNTKKGDTGASTSHARHDRMTDSEKDVKLGNLKREKAKMKKNIELLEQQVAKMMEKESVSLSLDDNGSLTDILDKNSTFMDSVLRKDTPMHLLWEEQKKYLSHKDPRRHRWHPTIIKWCISLYEKSPASYKMLRRSQFVKLPHQSTLHEYTHFTDAISGINPDILHHLVNEAKLTSCPEREKNVSLLFDEMKIKNGLIFSQRTGKISGFTELGDINDEFASFERRANNLEDPPLASHVLVLMVRGIFSGLKHPLAYYPCTGVSGTQLFHIMWEAVDVLEYAGFKVRALVSDGAAPNRKFYSMHGFRAHGTSQDGSMVTYCTENPNDPSRSIFFICDVPHLVKTTRNCFENSGWNSKTRNMRFKGKPIIWSHIIDLFNWDINYSTTSPGLRQLHKLTPDHIYLRPATRMRVYMAAQVLSESVASAMELRGLPETESTVTFIRHINKFFDCLNVSNLYQGNKGNVNKEPFKTMADERFKYLTTDFLNFLDEWEKEGADDPTLNREEKKRLCLSPQTLQGLRITVYSIVELGQQLLSEEDGVEYMLTEKFTQDPIEELFGDYRAAGGANDNPTTYQLGHTFNARIVSGSSAVRATTGSNVRNREREEDAEFVIEAAPLFKRQKKKD